MPSVRPQVDVSFPENLVTGDDAPGWMETVGNLFPLRPFVSSIQDSFNPFVPAPASSNIIPLP